MQKTEFKNIFSNEMLVEISSINYGGHLAHDRLITMMHESRLRFFDKIGVSEIDFYGVGLILKKINCDYKQEAFRGDKLRFYISINKITRLGFDINYKVYKVINKNEKLVAIANISLITFDYSKRKIARLADKFTVDLEDLTNRKLT